MPERRPFPFVVGCGRSGTTLVRAILDAHSEMAVPFESYFPVWFARHRDRYERPEGFATERFIADVAAHQSMAHWGLDVEFVGAQLRAAAPTNYPDAIRACFAAYATAQGKHRYADKTPIFVVHIPLLADLFPEAVFVHMVRDGRAVALSRTEAAWGTRRFEHEALLWREQVERGRADGRRLGSARYREFHYEALLDDPSATTRELCDFIGLDFEPQMLTYHENTELVLASQPFPDEHQNLRRPPTKGLRNWKTELTPAQVARFDGLAGETLDQFGYERGTASVPVRVRAQATGARVRYRSIAQYRSVRSAVWRAVHSGAPTEQSARPGADIRTEPGATINMEHDATTNERLRHRVTHRLPLSVRKLPFQLADHAVAVIDDRRLRSAHPDIAGALARATDAPDLRVVHDRYVTDISNWEWAVAWRTVLALDALCDARTPHRILDLGSGFSTYVECSWARRRGLDVEIVSVDDNPEWLETTRSFLAAEGLAAELIGIDELGSLADASFDLAFDDIGRIEVRAKVIDTIVRVMEPGGVVVLDDMNVRGYRGEVRTKLTKAGWPLYSLRNQTIDAKGRFAMLTTAPLTNG